MKLLTLSTMMTLFSLSAFAQSWTYMPTIEGASVNSEEKTITVNMKVMGGCGDHEYSLKIKRNCLQTSPVQCSAKIYDTTNDACEAIFFEQATFTFSELGLDDDYYKGASLTILGGETYVNGKVVDSQATVDLP